ncbi:hypothetical protein LRS74_00420 [Streptomyces sp. LX-29]|uniref:hypothetical protein n=1 Tax=Streptomyces sp. LX-29 TaxID=2900152 RepID=UPI00240D77FB|nr:hypothetical protein [Streptomyces sp. LX-29]WFB05647.1 hypothetical protein LRS74_00420 [Streptomyces sp. LX-29]
MLRPYEPADEQAVLDLVNDDKLPGQPPATASMLSDALADLGAEEVILLLDDEDEATAQDLRDRAAADALYRRAGFIQVDRLYAYTRSLNASPGPRRQEEEPLQPRA